MSDTASDTMTNTKVEPGRIRLGLDLEIAAVLKENCRKQEQDIQAIADSSYVVRRGRRELQDPKRLAMAIELRAKYMADVATFIAPIRDTELCRAYLRELLDGVVGELADSPDHSRRIARLFLELSNKYQPPAQKR
jgi:hypothetical protein